ncbi:hypothetical protein VSDG_04635 [Cytospora chrysosperma]|uniref:Serine aminopeptidase S33 domain-containing protein n=1 Tax=Cytospora chrysosperma TaxID=252740 RepID=A0A423W2J5_CYTCH|nr:hypothetical protein VSDG_04635 [Valsa sordida]
MDVLPKLAQMVLPPGSDSSTSMLVTTTAIMSVSLYTILSRIITQPRRPSILPSPLRTLVPALSPEQRSELLYPPDFFPGARDVPTPYGSIRCYEFGPAEGRKVLLVHGISTSCMTLTHIAHGLAERGCRVLLFDLFGRGFSDGVGDLPFDERLFVSQALLALASSELAWTGQGADDGFHLLGYSLGGGIAVHLAATLPRVVKSLILFAPAGMIREENFGTAARLVFRSGWLPEKLVEAMTRWRLRKPIAAAARRKPSRGRGGDGPPAEAPHMPGEQAIEAAVTSEIADGSDRGLPNALQRRVLKHVNWQVANHQGFVPAFMSTLRYAPMIKQHDTWRKLAAREPKTTLFVFGEGDGVVSDEDYREDVLPLVGGEEHVCWPKPLPGAHDFPMTHPEQALEQIWKFWGWDEDVGGSWLKA